MLLDKSVVKELKVAETMGRVNCICTGKTGILTQNKLTLASFWNDKEILIKTEGKGILEESFDKESHRNLIKQAFGCNGTASLKFKDGESKMDIAMLEFLERFQEDYETLRKEHVLKQADIFPFTSSRKRSSVVCHNIENGLPSKMRMHIRGASEIILDTCDKYFSFVEDKIIPMNSDTRDSIEKVIKDLANQAFTTICIGYKELEGDEDLTKKDDKGVFDVEKSGFILCGVLGIRDILKREAKDAVKKCKSAGIKVRMITGDSKITATAIARECGIIDFQSREESLVLEGPDFMERIGGIICKHCRLNKDCRCPRNDKDARNLKREKRIDTIANAEVFDRIHPKLNVLARSRPQDKYALVTGLIERGFVVAVTGDGTGDPPVLKKADVGIAINSGASVSKEASDIILINDNFASIIEVAKWSRNYYEIIKKILQFQLPVILVSVTITLTSVLVLIEPVIRSVNLLWIHLFIDTLASFALIIEPPSGELLKRKPFDNNESIISKVMIKHIFGQAILQFIILCIFTFSCDNWVPENLSKDYGPSRHYTMIFNVFVWMQIFNIFNARKIRDEINIFEGISRNSLFIYIVAIICGLQSIIVEFGNRAFNCSENCLSAPQWFICIAFASLTWIWAVLLKKLPSKTICSRTRNQFIEPLHVGSGVLRNINQFAEPIHDDFDMIRRRSITKVQYYKNDN